MATGTGGGGRGSTGREDGRRGAEDRGAQTQAGRNDVGPVPDCCRQSGTVKRTGSGANSAQSMTEKSTTMNTAPEHGAEADQARRAGGRGGRSHRSPPRAGRGSEPCEKRHARPRSSPDGPSKETNAGGSRQRQAVGQHGDDCPSADRLLLTLFGDLVKPEKSDHPARRGTPPVRPPPGVQRAQP